MVQFPTWYNFMTYFWLRLKWKATVMVVINSQIMQVTKNCVLWGPGGLKVSSYVKIWSSSLWIFLLVSLNSYFKQSQYQTFTVVCSSYKTLQKTILSAITFIYHPLINN